MHDIGLLQLYGFLGIGILGAIIFFKSRTICVVNLGEVITNSSTTKSKNAKNLNYNAIVTLMILFSALGLLLLGIYGMPLMAKIPAQEFYFGFALLFFLSIISKIFTPAKELALTTPITSYLMIVFLLFGLSYS